MIKNINFLRALKKASNPRDRKKILKGAGPRELNTISELAKNINAGRIPLTSACKKKLCRYKRVMRILASRKVKNPAKKGIIQRGGFIPLSLALSAIGPLISGLTELFRKK
jgi:hypothetical protein